MPQKSIKNYRKHLQTPHFHSCSLPIAIVVVRERARVCVSVFFQMKCILKWSVVFKCRIPMSVIIKIDTVTHSI